VDLWIALIETGLMMEAGAVVMDLRALVWPTSILIACLRELREMASGHHEIKEEIVGVGVVVVDIGDHFCVNIHLG